MINDYKLEIVSRDRRHDGKVFKPYNIDGHATIGVSKKEPFEIRFRNNSWQRVQVRFSMDGTDILTGEPATTSPDGKMWLVEGHASMTLKAWPETNSGGARFVFGEAGKSVAVNTHGNVEGMGVIAAAVFVEGARTIRQEPCFNLISSSGPQKYKQSAGRRSRMSYDSDKNMSGSNVLRGMSTNKGFDSDDVRIGVDSLDECCDTKCSASMGFMDMEMSRGVDFCIPSAASAMEPKAAIGAGEYVTQELVKGTGLTKPKFAQSVEIHYKWWREVQSALTKYGSAQNDSPNPYPGDVEEEHIDLSYTPRQGSTARCPFFPQYL